MIIKKSLHKKGFALALILKQRLAVSWKWFVKILFFGHFRKFIKESGLLKVSLDPSQNAPPIRSFSKVDFLNQFSKKC